MTQQTNAELAVTEAAARQLAAFTARKGLHVRLEIKAGGCSGFDIAFGEGMPLADDRRFGPPGAELLIDPGSLDLVNGATLNFVDEIGKEGFSVDNIPGTDARCGCGKSFSLG